MKRMTMLKIKRGHSFAVFALILLLLILYNVLLQVHCLTVSVPIESLFK